MSGDLANTVLISGGGIGGLTAALALADAGFRVVVFEQSAELGEIGAGIQLSPNCSRVLHHLGLQDALQARGFLPAATQFRHWRTGRVISENALGEQALARYGAPYYHVHRGDLLRMLADAASQRERISIYTDERLSSFSQSDRQVEVETTRGTYRGALLIGADGIHSAVRAALWGKESARFTGNVAWRALVPADRLPSDLVRPMSTAWWGPKRHFVHYYVRSGELVNCVCVVEKEGWERESWTEPGDVTELMEDFSGWHASVRQLIDSADHESLFKWALFDREPMSSWGRGRVSLLGDACHPTLPFMAQGAAMAIEDAAVLSACLQQQPDADGLQRYEDLRRERTAGIQRGSRRNATVFHLSGVKAWLRNRAVAAAGSRTMDGLYSYNALEAASLPSAE